MGNRRVFAPARLSANFVELQSLNLYIVLIEPLTGKQYDA
jgi:hypothetical protein